jgi:hypothetical protein
MEGDTSQTRQERTDARAEVRAVPEEYWINVVGREDSAF